jgi:hypothetical protein
VRLGDQIIQQWRFDAQKHAVILTLPDAARNWSVRLVF